MRIVVILQTVLVASGMLFFSLGLSDGMINLATEPDPLEHYMKDCMAGPKANAHYCIGVADRASNGYRLGQLAFMFTMFLVLLAHVGHMVSLVSYLRKGDARLLRTSVLWSMVPLTSPGIILGIPLGVVLWSMLRKEQNLQTDGSAG